MSTSKRCKKFTDLSVLEQRTEREYTTLLCCFIHASIRSKRLNTLNKQGSNVEAGGRVGRGADQQNFLMLLRAPENEEHWEHWEHPGGAHSTSFTSRTARRTVAFPGVIRKS